MLKRCVERRELHSDEHLTFGYFSFIHSNHGITSEHRLHTSHFTVCLSLMHVSASVRRKRDLHSPPPPEVALATI